MHLIYAINCENKYISSNLRLKNNLLFKCLIILHLVFHSFFARLVNCEVYLQMIPTPPTLIVGAHID